MEQIHWSTNRRREFPSLKVFAFDHRSQLEALADGAGVDHKRVGTFKDLCLTAAMAVANGQPGYGLLCDGRLGRTALYRAAGQGLWIARPVEWPASRPLTLEPEIGPDFGGLSEWPLEHVVKVLCFYHPADSDEMKAAQEETVRRLFHACRRNRLEMLLEIIPSKAGPVDDDTSALVIQRFYDISIYPDWWKLEPFKTDAAWANACKTIKSNDPHVRGIVVLGLEASPEDLATSFALARKHDLVKGFAVGRTIFVHAAKEWFAGRMTDAEAIKDMTTRYAALCAAWDNAAPKGQTA